MKKTLIRCLTLFALLYALCMAAWADDFSPSDGEAPGYIFQIRENSARSCAAELLQAEALFAAAGIYKTDDLALIEQLDARHLLTQYEEDAEIELCGILDKAAPLKTQDYRAAMLGYDYAKKNGITGTGIRIGIIDSGLWSGFSDHTGAEILEGTNFLVSEDSGDRHNVEDTYGHGTFVTGVICSTEYGLAPGASVLPLKCFDEKTSKYSYIISAINAAVNAKCKVINLSFGADDPYAPLETAIREALDAGIIVVAAAGNLGTGYVSTGNDAPMYPAAYEGVISVGSLDKTKTVAPNSKQNDHVTVVAPGVNVSGIKHFSSGWKTGTDSGTSFSAPVVSAAAALALSVKPTLTAAEFTAALTATAEDLGAKGKDNSYGCGLVNPALLLAMLREDTESVSLSYWDKKVGLSAYLGSADTRHYLSVYNADGKLLSVRFADQLCCCTLPSDADEVAVFSMDADTFSPLNAPRKYS